MRQQKYIYIDWNVFQYAKHKTKQGKIDGEFFYNKLLNQRKYQLPFSSAHLSDLAASAQHQYITEDINFLLHFSKGTAITLNSQNYIQITRISTPQIIENFNRISAELKTKKAEEIKVAGDISFQIDSTKITNDHLFYSLLEKNNWVLDALVLQKFILHLQDNINDHEFYRKFRQQISTIKSQFKRENTTVIDQTSDYFLKITPLLDFMAEQDPNLIKNTFESALLSHANISNTEYAKLPMKEKLHKAYTLLDFHPHFHDKITKRNRPFNMMRDLDHLFFAMQSKYYVTEDNSSYKKAKFLKDHFGFHAEILKMHQLIEIEDFTIDQH